MTPPVFFTEDGYKVHVSETHRAARLPFHWSVLRVITGTVVDHGRASSLEYAKHDARKAITEHKRQLEERAA